MHNIFDENDKLEKVLNYEQQTFSEVDFKSLLDEYSIAKQFEDILSSYPSKSIIQAIQNVTPILSEVDVKSLLGEYSIDKQFEDLLSSYPSKSIIQAIQNATPILSEVDVKSLLGEYSIDKQLSDFHFSEFFSDSLKLTIEKSQTQINEIAKSLRDILPILPFEAMDFSEIKMLSDMSIKYGDTVLSKEEVMKEFESQLEELKQKPKALYDKFEEVKKKFWLVLLIISLIMFIPQAIEASKFYTDIAVTIKALLSNETQYCWVIKEKAYLRENANAKSKVVCKLLYDTKLEIISENPRWLEVKYTDEAGDEYIGWISKISVEKE